MSEPLGGSLRISGCVVEDSEAIPIDEKSPTVSDAGPVLPTPHSGGTPLQGMRVSPGLASSKRIAGRPSSTRFGIGRNPHALLGSYLQFAACRDDHIIPILG